MRFSYLAVFVFAALGASIGEAEEFEETHRCDELAAHPADPNRWAAGVADEEIIPGPAVKFCRDAVEEHPDTARFQFQLGRALWANYRLEDGLQVFLTLEEEHEYGPVYAYLADAYMYGIGGVEIDEELAISLYQIAEEEGFSPASEVLQALEGGVQAPVEVAEVPAAPVAESMQEQAAVEAEPAAPAQAKAFNPGAFLEGQTLKALYDGDLEGVRMGSIKYLNVDKSYMYLSGFIQPFQENLNFRDDTCIYLANPALERAINYKLAASTPTGGLLLGNGRTLEQNLNAGAAQGFQMMGEMFKGMQNGQGMLGGGLGDIGRSTILKENGIKDATRLIALHGCQSEAVQRIFRNVGVYITGKGTPALSAAEQEKRADQARREEAKRERERQEAARKKEERRQAGFRTSAKASCMGRFDNDAYCSCALTSFENYQLSETDWSELKASFSNVIRVSKAHAGLGDEIRACRKKG